ncbi:unnamed protein product [Larinioides sclopetarius]|uniref:Uncharacterized protein n=1 Tax=Larinioides sclopetarius TaxID=280406 RepID=A0AAV2AF17_9ARAC
MESVITETLSCPLDNDFLKSWNEFSLECFHSHISSGRSESSDEDSEIKYEDLLKEFNSLSFDDVSDPKNVNSKCLNNISEINSLDKDNPGERKFEENKEIKEDQSSLTIKKEEFFKFDVEGDIQSTFSKCLNKNCEINSKKKNKTEKLAFEENLENVENQLASLSLKNHKSLKKYYNSVSGISTEDESDTDDDDHVESVILRERYPTRHNSTEKKEQMRTTPFSPNHSRTSKPHLNSNSSHAFENQILYDFNACHDGYNSINNIIGTDFEKYRNVSSSSRTYNSGFPTSKSMADKAFEAMATDLLVDQIFNNVIPCTAENQIVKGIDTLTDQIVDDAFPYTINEGHDSVVPSANDIGKFSEEINDISCFDNSKERIFSGCAVTSVEEESFLSSEEDVVNIVKYLEDSLPSDPSSQNHMDLLHKLHQLSGNEVENVLNNSPVLNRNVCVESISKKASDSNNNQHNFYPEPDHRHYSFSKANVGETSSFLNLNQVNSILEKSDQFYNSEYLVNKSDNCSNLVRKNEISTSCESLSFETSDHRVISNENEQEIIKWEEIKEWLNKGQKNVPEHPCEIACNVIPFDDLGNNTEGINISENNNTYGSNDAKRNNIYLSCNPPFKTEETEIYTVFGEKAKHKLFHDSSFCKSKWEHENREIREQIESGKLGTGEKNVIHFLKKNRKEKYKGTNLHHAIQSENTERAFCLVECHKEIHGDVFAINFRDSINKTVLDYSQEKGMDLLSDYLEENNAKPCVYLYK